MMVMALDGRAARWVVRRSIAPSSAAGISLALGLCAAAWFTAGTWTGDASGALALCGCYLAGHGAGAVAASSGGLARRTVSPGGLAGGSGSASGLASVPWLARMCSLAAECAVYAGLAAGAGSAGWDGTWQLGVTLIVILAVRQTLSACRNASRRATRRDAPRRAAPGEGAGAGEAGIVDRATEAILTMPPGGRMLLIAVVAPAWGPQAALLGLVTWAIAATGYTIAGHGGDRVSPGGSDPSPARSAGEPARHDLAALPACRDDGAFARFAGQLVRGQLVPLPPALAGLAAASMLAVLGLRNLPGAIALTPLVVMLLAAPGSSHRHDGRLDWLVPAVLQTGQYVYIAALGFASGVPGSIVFVLCAMIAIRSADVAYQAENGQPQMAAAATTGMGWEGRMFAAGLGAILGIATFAYLALAAYLAALICRNVLASCLVPGHPDRW